MFLKTSSFLQHCWCCKGSGARNSRELPAIAVLEVLESILRTATDAAAEVVGSKDAATRSDLERVAALVGIDGESQDDAAEQLQNVDVGGVAAVGGPALRGGDDAG